MSMAQRLDGARTEVVGYGEKPNFEFPCKVPPGKLFVLGDNRNGSLDSRHYGLADVQAVVGIAVIVYASKEPPLDEWEREQMRRAGKDPSNAAAGGGRVRWERIGTILTP